MYEIVCKLTHTFIILQPETFVTGTHRSAIDFFTNVIAGSVDARTLKIRFDLALWQLSHPLTIFA